MEGACIKSLCLAAVLSAVGLEKNTNKCKKMSGYDQC